MKVTKTFRNVLALIVVLPLSLNACRTASRSNTKDVGVVNTQGATTKVIYADQGNVYLKICRPPFVPPLTRNCTSDAEPKYLERTLYLFKLPYDVGPYQRDEQSLSLVTKALQDASKAVAGGNQNAVRTVDSLTPIKLNLEKILKIAKDLESTQQDLTYYEYHDEFNKLLAPFDERLPQNLPPNNGNNLPPNNGKELSCADYYGSATSLSSPMITTDNSPDAYKPAHGMNSLIKLRVPSDAVVFTEDTRVKTAGQTRSFGAYVPPARIWSWNIRVICYVGGKTFQTSKTVDLVPGRKVDLSIDPIHP